MRELMFILIIFKTFVIIIQGKKIAHASDHHHDTHVDIISVINSPVNYAILHYHGHYVSRKQLIPKEKMLELAKTFLNDLTVDEIKASALNL